MPCLKCGRETDQTFCERCRETMEKYPIKPGTFVFRPREHRPHAKWTPVRTSSTVLERQIKSQRRLLNRMAVAVTVLVLIVMILGFLCVRLSQRVNTRPVGQNYSIITPTEESTQPTTPEEPEPDPMFHVKH